MRQPLTERYRERLAGVLSCYDRIIVTGTLPGACYAKGNDRISLCAADPDFRLSAILPNRFAIECASAPPSWVSDILGKANACITTSTSSTPSWA